MLETIVTRVWRMRLPHDWPNCVVNPIFHLNEANMETDGEEIRMAIVKCLATIVVKDKVRRMKAAGAQVECQVFKVQDPMGIFP